MLAGECWVEVDGTAFRAIHVHLFGRHVVTNHGLFIFTFTHLEADLFRRTDVQLGNDFQGLFPYAFDGDGIARINRQILLLDFWAS